MAGDKDKKEPSIEMQNEKLPKLREGRVHGQRIFHAPFTGPVPEKKESWCSTTGMRKLRSFIFRWRILCGDQYGEIQDQRGMYFLYQSRRTAQHFVEKDGECMEDAVVFHMDILNFASSMDQVQTRLLQPIQNGRLLFPRCIETESPAFKTVRDAFLNIQNAFGRSCTGEGFATGRP